MRPISTALANKTIKKGSRSANSIICVPLSHARNFFSLHSIRSNDSSSIQHGLCQAGAGIDQQDAGIIRVVVSEWNDKVIAQVLDLHQAGTGTISVAVPRAIETVTKQKSSEPCYRYHWRTAGISVWRNYRMRRYWLCQPRGLPSPALRYQ